MARQKCTCWKSVKRCPVHPTKAETGLRYITESPSRENGGFHPETVATAKRALALIHRLRREAQR